MNFCQAKIPSRSNSHFSLSKRNFNWGRFLPDPLISIDRAKQLLSRALSIQPGEMLFSPTSGSYFSKYYTDHQLDINVLSHLLKLEVARLASLESKKGSIPLDFINRVLDVYFHNHENNSKMVIAVTIEWGNGEITTDDYQVYVGRMKT